MFATPKGDEATRQVTKHENFENDRFSRCHLLINKGRYWLLGTV